MIPVHRFMPDAIAAILRNAPLTDDKVAFAWRAAVGPAIDRGTTVALQARTLRVQARSVAWRQEVERSAALIRARLDTLLGEGVVGYIEVVNDAPRANR